MANFCKFELGSCYVDLQMVPSYYSTESEEQYAVYVRENSPSENS